jgi:hypothetical protein
MQSINAKRNYLEIDDLRVNRYLTVNGQQITSNGQGGASLSSYGELSATLQTINLTTSNAWVTIPFDTASLSSNMIVDTTSPAAITMQSNGIYQIGVSLYFSAANSDEGPFTPTTYALGIKINNTTTEVAAVYTNHAGGYSLTYTTLIALSANDAVRFYMQSSNGDGILANHITVGKCSAYLLQISS